MIKGIVNANLEGIVRLVVTGADGRQVPVEAVVDTGFGAYLTLQPAGIAALRLKWLGREEGILADGSVNLFDVYDATIFWNDQPRTIEVDAADAQSLVGMALLERYSLQMDVVSGGEVTITPLA